MKDIISPVDKALIAKELTPDKFLRKGNRGGNDLYVITAHDSPNTMQEVGRLRELSFRNAGGGTGKEADIDAFDDSSYMPYQQLIVWNEETQSILGGYRFIVCSGFVDIRDSQLHLASGRMFQFKKKFLEDYLPYTLELGRSFIVPEAQASKGGGRKSLFILDNLWDGLGAVVVEHPELKYLFGKVTMYPSYNQSARNLLLYFMEQYFPDDGTLVKAEDPLDLEMDRGTLELIFTGKSYKEDYKTLNKRVQQLGEIIPPLINSYMNLSPSMRLFETAINRGFGNVEETGILLNLEDIHQAKKERHLSTYSSRLKKFFFKKKHDK